jgi:hypothetical protein
VGWEDEPAGLILTLLGAESGMRLNWSQGDIIDLGELGNHECMTSYSPFLMHIIFGKSFGGGMMAISTSTANAVSFLLGTWGHMWLYR